MKHDADYVFYELTRSICPKCRKVIDAKVLLRDNKVYMRKRCPDCGLFEGLVYAVFNGARLAGTVDAGEGLIVLTQRERERVVHRKASAREICASADAATRNCFLAFAACVTAARA